MTSNALKLFREIPRDSVAGGSGFSQCLIGLSETGFLTERADFQLPITPFLRTWLGCAMEGTMRGSAV